MFHVQECTLLSTIVRTSAHLIQNNFCAKCIELKTKINKFSILGFNIYNKKNTTVLSEIENFDIGIALSKE